MMMMLLISLYFTSHAQNCVTGALIPLFRFQFHLDVTAAADVLPYNCSFGRGRVRATAGPVHEHYEAEHRRLRDAADQDLWQ